MNVTNEAVKLHENAERLRNALQEELVGLYVKVNNRVIETPFDIECQALVTIYKPNRIETIGEKTTYNDCRILRQFKLVYQQADEVNARLGDLVSLMVQAINTSLDELREISKEMK